MITVEKLLATPSKEVNITIDPATQKLTPEFLLQVEGPFGGSLFVCAEHYALLLTGKTFVDEFVPTTNIDEVLDRGLVGRYGDKVEVFTDVFRKSEHSVVRIPYSFYLPHKEPVDTFWIKTNSDATSVLRITSVRLYEIERVVTNGNAQYEMYRMPISGASKVRDSDYVPTTEKVYFDMVEEAKQFMLSDFNCDVDPEDES